ncbi:MAG: hypothetical protein JWQ79_3847 [Mucilaginibacter sp.]|nr:hypothetical protein [Mucilaginibacter sp.]
MKSLEAIISSTVQTGERLAALDNSGLPKSITKAIFRLYNFNANRKLRKSNNVILPKLEKDITDIKAFIERSDFKRHGFPKAVNNKLFFSISIKDIILTHKQFMAAKDKEEQNLLARSLALHLHEYLNDFQKLTGKSFRQELLTIPYPEQILKEFDSIKLGYKTISDRYIKTLADVRHNSIGHKTKDAKILIDNIKQIDALLIREIETISLLLYALYDKFHNSIFLHIMKYPNEIAKMPYLNKDAT